MKAELKSGWNIKSKTESETGPKKIGPKKTEPKKKCGLCFHGCLLDEGQTGLCRARTNRDGKIVSLNYGRITSLALDPVEKKPLRRFHPGSMVLSAGSFGCNLNCPFCQNAGIAAAGDGVFSHYFSPEALVQEALNLRSRGNIGVAYTYNEPLVGFEYVLDCAALVREAGMYNILVTNGTVEEAPWRSLLQLTDAVNIDLKGFTEDWYRTLGGDLGAVRRSIEIAAESCHVEVTALIVPGENDSEEEMRRLAAWLASLRPDIPLHVSRFFPRHRMTDRPPTPVETVFRLADTAREYLKYVYTGNC